jgi:PIN domain nuclease of toxin-antitoxin system
LISHPELLVADTHSLAWYPENSPRLSQDARLAFASINRGDSMGIISTIVPAELMHISERGRVAVDFEMVVSQFRRSQNFRIVNLDFDVLMRNLSDFELHDRMIVATALLVGAHVITRDSVIRNSGIVECVW